MFLLQLDLVSAILVRTVELEADGVAALAAVHMFPERQDQLQHLPEVPFAALDLFTGLQHSLNLFGLIS